jgi:hypothetical protein
MEYLIVIALVALSALFSGLTLGFFSLNKDDLERKVKLGDAQAKEVYSVRKDGNLLLCTLLIYFRIFPDEYLKLKFFLEEDKTPIDGDIYLNEVYLGKKGANKEKAGSIVQTNECFKAIIFLNLKHAFYIFYTSRDATIAGDEFAAFLGPRGGRIYDKKGDPVYRPGRPVLRHTELSPLNRHESKSDGSIPFWETLCEAGSDGINHTYVAHSLCFACIALHCD